MNCDTSSLVQLVLYPRSCLEICFNSTVDAMVNEKCLWHKILNLKRSIASTNIIQKIIYLRRCSSISFL